MIQNTLNTRESHEGIPRGLSVGFTFWLETDDHGKFELASFPLEYYITLFMLANWCCLFEGHGGDKVF
jgi:hypothetical protein